MSTFEIISAKPWHCGQMVRLLRDEHHKATAEFGVSEHRELRACFEASSFKRAWLIDGKLAALGGVTGTRLSPVGYVWLAMSQAATRYPVATVKEARRQLAEIMSYHHELKAKFLSGDETARRFALRLGFVPTGVEGDLLCGSLVREAA